MTEIHHFEEVIELTGSELLERLGIHSTGVRKTFVVNGGDERWTAWMTRGRGRQHGKKYIHIVCSRTIPIVDSETREEIGRHPRRFHFRGPVDQRIGGLKVV